MKLYPKINLLFGIWATSIFAICYLGFSLFPHSGVFTNDFKKSFSNWDGGHFIGIAEHGYKEKFQYAFFPLYPLVIRSFSQITQNYLTAALVISVVSSFLALHILYRLLQLDFDKKTAEKTILALIFFPTSFYLISAYSEGLFFFLTVLTFYFLRQNRLFLATTTTALLSATRLVGLVVVLTLLFDVQTRGGINRKNWFVLLSPVGFFAYCWFLYNQTGDPFYFITAENHWQRFLVAPGISFWETLRGLSSNGFILSHTNAFLDLIFAIFGVGLSIRSFRFLPQYLSVYSLISVGLPLLTPTLSSMPRFLLPIFPIFILVAQVKNQYIALAYQIISLMLLSAFAILFVNGFWVS